LLLREHLGRGKILRGVWLAASFSSQVHRQTLDGIGIGNGFHATRYVRTPPIEFTLHLADDSSGPLSISPFERLAD
jgi:hypothetical protein